MALAHSKITSQGQISIPVQVRRKLGVGPGSVLEWKAEGEKITVQRVGQYSFEDLHRMVFPDGPPKRRSLKALKEGAARYVKERHARGRY
jgi:AbrB family looped-hinge helix DNA binding protein